MSHIRGYVSREYCFHFMQVLQSTLLNLKKSICINLIYGSLLWLQQGKKKKETSFMHEWCDINQRWPKFFNMLVLAEVSLW